MFILIPVIMLLCFSVLYVLSTDAPLPGLLIILMMLTMLLVIKKTQTTLINKDEVIHCAVPAEKRK
ncbi:hypothetical protein P9911_029490 [Klebsiella oxytoca]|uniref:hypothetical protein n=1 Tax=Klebsiella oxytoca TaxID=571 RepID=UPI00254C38E1|nr:hypothetical protein [Klebsiella oxytoca]MEC5509939.1 hypothetical protein [Klebsiella oxytoca]